jgi:protein arginine N-methyltransferase 7
MSTKTNLFQNPNHPLSSSSKLTFIRTMSSTSSQRMFQLKLDPLTGNSEWVIIEENNNDEEQSFHQPLLATTSYLDMLNDSTRNTAFRQSIEKTVTKPCHVLDIGYSHCCKF